MTLTLPLDHAAIERILPHRYPFLLVDRITEFEADKRIVGIKNVTLNERYLAHREGELPVLPPTILTEAIAQVGAIMILAKPENRRPHAVLRRHRARPLPAAGPSRRRGRHRSGRPAAAQPHGHPARHRARRRPRRRRRHDDLRARPRTTRVGAVREPRPTAQPTRRRRSSRRAIPTPPTAIRMEEADRVQHRRDQDQQADLRLLPAQRVRHAARVALDRPGARERGARVGDRRPHVEREDPLERTGRARGAGSDGATESARWSLPGPRTPPNR